jgi:hypothetical protein
MQKITFTKLMTVTRPPIEVENWPGYRTGLSNLPGVNLVLAHRTAKQFGEVVTLSKWGVYDEGSGFYLNIFGSTRTKCYELAVAMLGHYTPESYAEMIEGRYHKRITAILTGGMK